MGLPNRSRETKFSGAKADREIFIYPAQLTTSRIGNLTRLIHITIAICIRTMTIHTYYTLILIAMKEHENRGKTKMNPTAARFCYILSGIGWVSALSY